MPFKRNAACRHRIPKARHRVRNWRAYEAGLKRRGDLTLWLDEAAVAGWQASRRTTPGGQAWYSDAAIELVLMLRLVFHLALRRAEGAVVHDPCRPPRDRVGFAPVAGVRRDGDRGAGGGRGTGSGLERVVRAWAQQGRAD